jgi:hypothetical protein
MASYAVSYHLVHTASSIRLDEVLAAYLWSSTVISELADDSGIFTIILLSLL